MLSLIISYNISSPCYYISPTTNKYASWFEQLDKICSITLLPCILTQILSPFKSSPSNSNTVTVVSREQVSTYYLTSTRIFKIFRQILYVSSKQTPVTWVCFAQNYLNNTAWVEKWVRNTNLEEIVVYS